MEADPKDGPGKVAVRQQVVERRLSLEAQMSHKKSVGRGFTMCVVSA